MTDRCNPLTWGGAIVLLTVIAYSPALSAGYIWDDDKYLVENPLLGSFGGLLDLWVPGNTPQYYPVVFTSFWLEHALWGLSPLGYHLINILLHGLVGVLVWRLARRLALPGAWMIGAVFALHPVHVESVAWVTERKNVLSGVFYLLAAHAYLRFDARRERSSDPTSPWRYYGLALAAFVLALLSKSVTCSLPAALILLFVLQRQPLTARRLVPLLPFFAIGLALAMHTAHLERILVGADGADFDFSIGDRFQIAGHALVFYPQKILWPWPLIFFYPRLTLDDANITLYWPWLVILVVTVMCLTAFARGRRGPAIAVAFFAGTVFPALGFFNVYPHRFSFVADHFQYLASLGVIALVVGAATVRVANYPSVTRPLAGLVLAALGVMTWLQSSTYADSETLWNTTIERNPTAWIAYNNLAADLTERGEREAALELLGRAIPLTTSERAADQMRFNRALLLSKLQRHREALRIFQILQQTQGDMELRIAQTLERLQRDEEAERYYRLATSGPPRAEAALPFGLHLMRRGRPEEALSWLSEHLEGRPQDVSALMFLADAYDAAGRVADASRTARRALQLARAAGDRTTASQIDTRLRQYRK